MADERAFGVLTVTMETYVWVQVAFIHINTSSHIH